MQSQQALAARLDMAFGASPLAGQADHARESSDQQKAGQRRDGGPAPRPESQTFHAAHRPGEDGFVAKPVFQILRQSGGRDVALAWIFAKALESNRREIF